MGSPIENDTMVSNMFVQLHLKKKMKNLKTVRVLPGKSDYKNGKW